MIVCLSPNQREFLLSLSGYICLELRRNVRFPESSCGLDFDGRDRVSIQQHSQNCYCHIMVDH
jgi:hypothetical protein